MTNVQPVPEEGIPDFSELVANDNPAIVIIARQPEVQGESTNISLHIRHIDPVTTSLILIEILRDLVEGMAGHNDMFTAQSAPSLEELLKAMNMSPFTDEVGVKDPTEKEPEE